MAMKKILLLIIAIIIILPLAWYLASPLFIDKKVSEENPLNENTQESLYSGSFSGADSFHQVKGKVVIISDGKNKYLRLENFESTNGPDLKVYLSEDIEANSYISLGELKGNLGNQNYELPAEVDLEKYNYALIWCEKFSVLFGQARLE